MCLHVSLNTNHNILYLPFDLTQPKGLSGTKKHTFDIKTHKCKDCSEIIPLQTFQNADIQLNCNFVWLFGSLFTPTTLLQSHTSNYLHAGVSTYGYDSFCLTTAINSSERSKLFNRVRDRWQIWREIFHDLQHTWGGDLRGGKKEEGRGWKGKRKNNSKVSFYKTQCGTRHSPGGKYWQSNVWSINLAKQWYKSIFSETGISKTCNMWGKHWFQCIAVLLLSVDDFKGWLLWLDRFIVFSTIGSV